MPQKTLKPECRHDESMAIISLEIFPLSRSILNILCRKMAYRSPAIEIAADDLLDIRVPEPILP